MSKVSPATKEIPADKRKLELQFVNILDSDRLDCSYHSAGYANTINEIERLARTKGFELTTLAKILLGKGKDGMTGGATPLGAAYISEGVPFVRIQNVTEMGLDLSNVVYIAKQIHEGELERSQLHEGNVLLTITGSYGISTTVHGIKEANINQHVAKITVNASEILPDFLSLYLNSVFGRNQMDRDATGGTRLALEYRTIKQLKILKPSIPLQKKIIDSVSDIHNKARKIERRIAETEVQYDSVVLEKLNVKLPHEPKLKTFSVALGEAERIEVKWHYPFLREIMQLIASNKSKKLKYYQHELKYGASIDADYQSSVPFLRIENLRRNFIDLSDLQYVSKAMYQNEIKGLYLQKGDVLIERSGTYVGLCSYVPKGMEDYVHGSYIIRLRLHPNETRIDSRYLSVYLNSILGRLQYDIQKTGALQFNINTEQIKDVTIIEPSLNIQGEIASEVFKLIDSVKALREQYDQTIQEAKNLFVDLLKNN